LAVDHFSLIIGHFPPNSTVQGFAAGYFDGALNFGGLWSERRILLPIQQIHKKFLPCHGEISRSWVADLH
jgi:hypothetical protein